MTLHILKTPKFIKFCSFLYSPKHEVFCLEILHDYSIHHWLSLQNIFQIFWNFKLLFFIYFKLTSSINLGRHIICLNTLVLGHGYATPPPSPGSTSHCSKISFGYVLWSPFMELKFYVYTLVIHACSWILLHITYRHKKFAHHLTRAYL
jgi:hypothetical protein